MSDEITIRRAESIADYRACQEAQRRAWGISEEQYVVPIATMVGAQLHGGLVLGAFRADGSAVGLSFAFLGRVEGRLGLYSQLTGVVPGLQGQGIGGRLKHAQRELARADGLEFISWAFDPLQAGNAHFNLGQLAARSHTYIENMYGQRTDALNAGVATDRLIAIWPTTEAPPRTAIEPAVEQLHHAVNGVARPDGWLDPAICPIAHEPATVLIEIPPEIGRLRTADAALAERWRSAVAGAFVTLFAVGYEAVDFVRTKQDGATRCFYVLTRIVSRE